MPISCCHQTSTFKPLLTTSACIQLSITVAKCQFFLTAYIYLLTFQYREESSLVIYLFLNLISLVSWIPIHCFVIYYYEF